MPEAPQHPVTAPAEHVQTGKPRRTGRFAIISLVIILFLAGVVSLYASSSPDGLEKVAGDTGFIDTATGHAADGSPLAGYEASFIDGPLGQTVAGVVGVLVTLLIFYGLVRFLRRRDPQQHTDRHTDQHADRHTDRHKA